MFYKIQKIGVQIHLVKLTGKHLFLSLFALFSDISDILEIFQISPVIKNQQNSTFCIMLNDTYSKVI